jgi:hypothetical protein
LSSNHQQAGLGLLQLSGRQFLVVSFLSWAVEAATSGTGTSPVINGMVMSRMTCQGPGWNEGGREKKASRHGKLFMLLESCEDLDDELRAPRKGGDIAEGHKRGQEEVGWGS